MKNVGKYLKNYIESNGLSKSNIAQKCNITPTYLSIIFHKSTIDCALLEKLCKATGINPAEFFDVEYSVPQKSKTTESFQIEMLNKLLDEKERMIQFLISKSATSN